MKSCKRFFENTVKRKQKYLFVVYKNGKRSTLISIICNAQSLYPIRYYFFLVYIRTKHPHDNNVNILCSKMFVFTGNNNTIPNRKQECFSAVVMRRSAHNTYPTKTCTFGATDGAALVDGGGGGSCCHSCCYCCCSCYKTINKSACLRLSNHQQRPWGRLGVRVKGVGHRPNLYKLSTCRRRPSFFQKKKRVLSCVRQVHQGVVVAVMRLEQLRFIIRN